MLFAPAVAAAYVVARATHYVVYTAGIPVVRTLTFSGAWAAVLALVVVGGLL